jgi:hypothetical protein
LVRSDTTAKSAQRQERHAVKENKLTSVNGVPLREDAKDHKL